MADPKEANVEGNDEHPTVSFSTPIPEEATLTQEHGSTASLPAKFADQTLSRLGEYDILGEIARGGMGVVFKAKHLNLNRMVALKVMQTRHLSSDADRKRFQAEVEAAGQLDHPNIVPIYAAGEADGYQYFSMALVDGPSLAQRVTESPLSPRDATALIRQVAMAVAYAHAHGVVHRDIKPGNILLDSTGLPRITDFGLAKRIDTDSSLTQAGQIMGTPSYMPPEQAEGKNEQVGPLADVYSLGATLYCLLTGRPPFQAATVVDTLKQVVEREPVAPHLLNPAVHRDLETICLKCLQKRPERRYATASDLGDDLQRFLDRRPILARPVGTLERGVRWCRRNPAVAAALVMVTAVVLSAFTLVSGSYVRAERARKNEAEQRAEAERKEKDERWERYRSNLIAAGSAMRLHNVAAARDALDVAPEEHRGWEWRHFATQLDAAAHVHPGFGPTGIAIASPDRGTIVLHVGPDQTPHLYDPVARRLRFDPSYSRYTNFARFSRDGKLVGFPTHDNTVEVWDVAGGRRRATLTGHTDRLEWLDFNPDGGRVVTGGADRTARVWDTASGKQVLVLPPHAEGVGRVLYTPDGKRIFTHSGRTAYLWDAASGSALGTYPAFATNTGIGGDIVPNPAGDRLAVAEDYPSNRIRLLDLAAPRVAVDLVGHTNQTIAFVFSPDGTRFASCGYDQTIRLWNPADGSTTAVMTGHAGWVTTLAFSPDGTRLATGSQDQTVRVWDANTGSPVAVLHGHTSTVELVTYLPDGGAVAAVGRDGTIRTFDTRLAERSGVLRGHTGFAYGVAFHPDGERVASAAWDGTVRVWNATTGKELAIFKHADKAIVTAVAFHPDGRHLASQGRDDDVRLWDLETNKLVHRFPLPTQHWQDSRLAFSRDGKLLAAGARDNTTRVWDVASRAEVAVLTGHTQLVRDLVFAADGSWLVTASEGGDGTVRIWDLVRKAEVRTLCRLDTTVYALALSPDGATLAAGSHDGTVRMWDTSTWAETAVLTQGTNVYGLSFTPDGTRLAVACANNTIRLWDVPTGKAVGELHGHTAYVHQVAFSPDGSRLVSASGDNTLRVWDTRSASDRSRAK